jgi:hypothetical protein
MKTGMTRNIPSRNNNLLFFMTRTEKDYRERPDEEFIAEYEKWMVKREEGIEKWLKDTFSHLGINATVKSDRYSLPIQNQIKVTQYGESYLNGAFETFELCRKVIKEILEKNCYKVRFYVFAEVEDSFPMGKVNYYFNYYI